MAAMAEGAYARTGCRRARRVPGDGSLLSKRGGYACGMPRRVKTEVFADLADPVLFPRLPEAKIERLAARGQRRVYQTDELLFEQGQRDAPFFVIENGTVDIIDRRPNEELWFARMDGGTFIGDVSMFTGEPTIAAGVADEPTSTIVFERPQLREMLAEWPEFGELVLQTMTARRAWLEGHDVGVLRLIASRRSRRAFEVRDLLERNLLPVRWYDVDTDAESAALLDTLGIPRSETPVLVRIDGVLRNPSAAQVARTLLVATGAQWRTLDVEGVDRFKGAGVYHVAMATDARRCEGDDVIVVGGGNSAGQAAVHLARRARSVRMVLRGDNVSATMSRYLLNRIERMPNIEVVTGTEVAAVHGNGALEAVSLRESGNGRVQRIPTSAVFVMIGAQPCTDFVGSMLAVDDAGFVLCGPAARERGFGDSSREPYLLETVRPGVFVAGDVRSESTKRVAGAVGDGALAVRFAHQVLDR